ncbi:SRPBCC domain-containing protein [Candidatus Micrarchaeota archaeon]|nr:SRPBCC domain-containing protein [Candidatus Micrarchaeota archaeon]
MAPALEPFIIFRILDAPRELVWAAFTDPARMKDWWGPKGFTVLKSAMDLRVGGTYFYGMRSPDGKAMWGKFVYREIQPISKMVWVNSFSDETGGITRHPFAPDWPLQLLTTLTLAKTAAGKTELTLVWIPMDATESEMATFDAGRDSMTGGWTGTFEGLEAYLAQVKKS